MNGESNSPTIGLDEIATASFRTTAIADDQAKRLKDALGFGAFNVPARLAIARSLAISEPPEETQGDVGRGIKGDTLFGTGVDLAAWVSLIIEYAGAPPQNLRQFQGWVAAHWARGLGVLATTMNAIKASSGAPWRRQRCQRGRQLSTSVAKMDSLKDFRLQLSLCRSARSPQTL